MAKTMYTFRSLNIYQYMYMFRLHLAEVKEASFKYLRLLHLLCKNLRSHCQSFSLLTKKDFLPFSQPRSVPSLPPRDEPARILPQSKS